MMKLLLKCQGLTWVLKNLGLSPLIKKTPVWKFAKADEEDGILSQRVT